MSESIDIGSVVVITDNGDTGKVVDICEESNEVEVESYFVESQNPLKFGEKRRRVSLEKVELENLNSKKPYFMNPYNDI